MYREVIGTCWKTFIEIVSSAKFIFFSIVAISIGTMGIWVPVLFELDLSSGGNTTSKATVENFPIFMYVVGVLGTLAAEYFIRNEKFDEDRKQAVQSFSMLVWFIAIVLSFWALKDPKGNTWQLWLSLWLTISLWMSFTKKDDFSFTDTTKSQLEGNGNNAVKFGGKGL